MQCFVHLVQVAGHKSFRAVMLLDFALLSKLSNGKMN